MEAKDTVMNELEMRVVLNEASWQSPTIPFSYHFAIANAQAKQTELMLKEQWKQEGKKVVVEWVEAHRFHTCSFYSEEDWQAQVKKEWGL